jgi:hypothetical protein
MMKKIGLLFVLALAFQLNGKEIISGFEEPILQEMSFEIPLKNLIVDAEGISAIYGGKLFPVNSLQRKGDLWVVTTVHGRNAGYCQRGHDLCAHCELCHKEGCWYYVEPCWKK